MIGIYKITNPKGKVYVGQSVDLQKRQGTYRRMRDMEYQRKLFNSIKKYGWKTHKFEILEECTKEQLNQRERYWQDFYNVLSKNGLNCILTTCKDKSGTLSEVTKKKIGDAHRGKKHTGERLEKSRQCMKKAYLALRKPVQLWSHEGELIAEYESINDARRVTGFDWNTINDSIKGITKRNRHGKWKYKH